MRRRSGVGTEHTENLVRTFHPNFFLFFFIFEVIFLNIISNKAYSG
jgi:hypothetical protein